jgi:NitT/TauT family transport system permease protein
MLWYVLFNCLGGVATIPHDIAQAIKSMGLTRFQLWRRLVFPAMRPALVTGAITAWGGGWNTLVVAEYVVHKDQLMTVRGIGSLLNHSVYQLGDTPSILFCVTAMVGWIIFWNFLFWQRVYHSAIERYKFEG